MSEFELSWTVFKANLALLIKYLLDYDWVRPRAYSRV